MKIIKPMMLYSWHSGSVWSVAFSPDGKRIVSGSSDQTIRVWDASSGQQMGEPIEIDRKAWALSISASGLHHSGHSGSVLSVAFSADGKMVASGGSDTTICLWDMDIQLWRDKACQRAGRNLTLAEWNAYYSENISYEATCPDQPLSRDIVQATQRRWLQIRWAISFATLIILCALSGIRYIQKQRSFWLQFAAWIGLTAAISGWMALNNWKGLTSMQADAVFILLLTLVTAVISAFSKRKQTSHRLETAFAAV
jgi:hypothetical protein